MPWTPDQFWVCARSAAAISGPRTHRPAAPKPKPASRAPGLVAALTFSSANVVASLSVDFNPETLPRLRVFQLILASGAGNGCSRPASRRPDLLAGARSG